MSSLNPNPLSTELKPEPKSDAERALERAVNHTDDVDPAEGEDREADLARTAEQNDRAERERDPLRDEPVTNAPLHGNTH